MPTTLIKADCGKLREVLLTFLANAAKFSPLNSPIRVRIDYKDPHYIISITDENFGFTQVAITNEHKKTDSGSYKAGMSFGLYLSRKIIEYHRGFIVVSKKKDKKTNIKIYIPKLIH